MKAKIIQVDEIEKYLKLIKLEHELKVRLHLYNEQQKTQLERLERINVIAQRLRDLKPTNWKFEDLEIRKAIIKYARYR